MGLNFSNFSQKALSKRVTLDDLRGSAGGRLPQVFIAHRGNQPRQKCFRALFKDSGAKVITNEEGDALEQRIEESIAAVADASEAVRVGIDVSCLSRPEIARAFAALVDECSDGRRLHVTMCYSLAAFAPPPAVWATLNRAIRPVHRNFSGWSSSGASRPLDIVVGLGYEKGKAIGAVEYLEPRNRWVFVPESPQGRYLDLVKEHNKSLIENSDAGGNVIVYDLMTPIDTYFALRSLVTGMARDARPVLLPFGPKLFFALCLMVSAANREASVWHVTGESDEYAERRPSEHTVLLSFDMDASTMGLSATETGLA